MVVRLWKESVSGHYYLSISDRHRVHWLSSQCSLLWDAKDNGCVEERMMIRLCVEGWAEGAMWVCGSASLGPCLAPHTCHFVLTSAIIWSHFSHVGKRWDNGRSKRWW